LRVSELKNKSRNLLIGANRSSGPVCLKKRPILKLHGSLEFDGNVFRNYEEGKLQSAIKYTYFC
jgi:hypothetical protein